MALGTWCAVYSDVDLHWHSGVGALSVGSGAPAVCAQVSLVTRSPLCCTRSPASPPGLTAHGLICLCLQLFVVTWVSLATPPLTHQKAVGHDSQAYDPWTVGHRGQACDQGL